MSKKIFIHSKYLKNLFQNNIKLSVNFHTVQFQSMQNIKFENCKISIKCNDLILNECDKNFVNNLLYGRQISVKNIYLNCHPSSEEIVHRFPRGTKIYISKKYQFFKQNWWKNEKFVEVINDDIMEIISSSNK